MFCYERMRKHARDLTEGALCGEIGRRSPSVPHVGFDLRQRDPPAYRIDIKPVIGRGDLGNRIIDIRLGAWGLHLGHPGWGLGFAPKAPSA